ncbi:MAG TPA: SRPBCC domain-containing protein [Terriglobales bacterium]|nr:SRPBCC domain-containing protein [Terriglobales bacterium]
MSNTTITPDSDVIVSEIDIAAPPERVFKAITDPEEIRRRSPGLDDYEMELRVGGKWSFEMNCAEHPYHGVSLIRHEGEILELDPPRLLVHTWLANFHKNPKMRSVVRWELTPTKTGTHVKLTHSGLASEPESAKDYAGGWPGVLEEVKTFVEKQGRGIR